MSPVTRVHVLAASYLTAASMLFGNIQPLLLGSMAEHLDTTHTQIGILAAALLLTSGLVKAAAPWWIRRVNLRTVCCCCVAVAAIASMSAGHLHLFPLVVVALAVFGYAEGGFGTVAYTVLGDFGTPSQAYATSLVFSMLLAAAATLFLSAYVAPTLGHAGVMTVFSLIVVTGVLAVPLLPRSTLAPSFRAQSTPRSSPPNFAPFIAAMLASVLFLAPIMAIWAFSERFGSSVGIALPFVGMAVAIASLVTAGSAFVASVLSSRVNHLSLAWAGIVCLILSLVVLADGRSATFLVGISGLSFGWGLAQPFFHGQVRLCDPSDRFFTAVPALVSFGVALGVAAGGVVVDAFGFNGLMMAAGTALAVSGVVLQISDVLKNMYSS